jgi:hypothetical protein
MAVCATIPGERPMKFYGAIRGEPGKAVSDDAFACLGDRAILLDGAGNAQGAAKCCIDFLIAQLEARPDMPLNELIGIANQFFLDANQESTLLALRVQGSSLLTAVSCGDSPLYLVRGGRVEQNSWLQSPIWHFLSGRQTSSSERVMGWVGALTPAQPVLFCNQRHILPKPLRCQGKNASRELKFSQVSLSCFGAIFCG